VFGRSGIKATETPAQDGGKFYNSAAERGRVLLAWTKVYSFSEIGSCPGLRLNKLQTSLSSADGPFAENE
jgi:hypothetical protein